MNYSKIPVLSELSNRLGEWGQELCAKYPLVRNVFCPVVPLVYADDDCVSTPVDAVLVLPPSEYWAMRVELSVRNEAEAEKYGPALFDLGEGYGFQARKEGENRYILVAYERDRLAENLRSNPAFSSVRKITFAQWVFGESEFPIRLKTGKYLAVVEGIVIELDASYVSDVDTRLIDEALAHPPAFYKTIDTDGLLNLTITPKTLKITLAVLIVAFANLIAQFALDGKAMGEIDTKIGEVLESSHLPGTSIEREAVIESLKRKEEKQMKLREQCYELGTVSLKVAVPQTTSAAVPVASAATDGVVLIPGSKPGEPNRLLVGGGTEPAVSSANVAGFGELQYDGNSIKVRIGIDNAESGETVKNEILKKFKKARIEVHDKEVEVRLK